MILEKIPAGANPPWDLNVIIEIPAGADPVKYEIDKESSAVFVDRFLSVAMFYPCNYGFIPQTLADDGDPLDVLVIAPNRVVPGAVMRCRPIGMLEMEDEKGGDEKILAVPVHALYPGYDHIKTYTDIPQIQLDQLIHFFQHYKDLEKNKWVKLKTWQGPEVAAEYILRAIGNVKK